MRATTVLVEGESDRLALAALVARKPQAVPVAGKNR